MGPVFETEIEMGQQRVGLHLDKDYLVMRTS